MRVFSDFLKTDDHETDKPEVGFFIEMVYVDLSAIKDILTSLDSVSNIQPLRAFPLMIVCLCIVYISFYAKLS